jgi:CIC family chloride channel protein
LILAIVLALMAHLYINVFYGVRTLFDRININKIFKPAIGGLLTGAIGLTVISLFNDHKFAVDIMGGGYGVLQEIFTNGISNIGIVLLLVIGVGKIFTTSFSISSGGSAGVFGPSMVIGGAIGTSVGVLLDKLMPGVINNPISFTIVGMAGFFAAAASTPLSTIIMVSELTGNYELLLPSMWVCTIAYFIGRKWTIYKSQVPNPNYSQAHFGRYAPDIIDVTSVKDCYKKSRQVIVINASDGIQDILKAIEKTRQRIFPVIDDEGALLGGFNTDDITHVLQNPDNKIQTASELIYTHLPLVHPDDNLSRANKLMNDNFMDEALIVEDSEEQKILGIITSSDIILAYNRKLSEIKYVDQDSSSSPYDKKLLKTFSLKKILEKDLLTVKPDDTLRDLVHAIIKSKRNVFPVVDEFNQFHGVILLNDIRELMFDTSKYDETKVEELMTSPPDKVLYGEKMELVIEKFERTGAWNLPVIDKNDKYLGLVSKSSIFSVYRNALIHQTEI